MIIFIFLCLFVYFLIGSAVTGLFLGFWDEDDSINDEIGVLAIMVGFWPITVFFIVATGIATFIRSEVKKMKEKPE